MKYDLSKHPTRGAQRTLDAFYLCLIKCLTTEAFEKINVNELCESARYPRATFYNYFDDKYDLLDYCFRRQVLSIHIEDAFSLPEKEIIPVFFDRICSELTAHQTLINKIIAHNPPDRWFCTRYRYVVSMSSQEIITKRFNSKKFTLPSDIFAKYIANTLNLFVEYNFTCKGKYSQAELKAYLVHLLKSYANEK